MSRHSRHSAALTLVWVLTCGALGTLSACGGKDGAEPGASGGYSSTLAAGGSSPNATSGGSGTLTTGGASVHAAGGTTAELSNAARNTLVSGGTGMHPTSRGRSGTGAGSSSGELSATGGSTTTWVTGGTSWRDTGATGSKTGGSQSTRGPRAVGGSQSTGGTRAVGGLQGTGGAPTSGGANGNGGSAPTTGGSPSSGGSSGSPLGGDGAVLAFTTNYVTPFCERLADCCTKAGYPVPSAASCATTELQYYVDALADGSAQPNDEAIASYLSAISSGCDQPSYALMARLVAGTRPTGADCTDVSQCAGDSVACIIPKSSSSGKCTPLARGVSGDPCHVGCNTTTSCRWTINGGTLTDGVACWDEDGLRCDNETSTCVPLAGIGQTCDWVECGEHASCLDGKCVAKGQLGDDCRDGRSCESTLSCSATDTCEKVSIAWSGSCGE